MLISKFKLLAALAVFSALLACGGGGGGSSTASTTTTTTPSSAGTPAPAVVTDVTCNGGCMTVSGDPGTSTE
ncbi:hypothetical protein [Polynucleobacter sp. JS-Fieb-80-E5]|uniref:hypothetical protein n=1 Tax=Polynucleobacter sp. JS-Fieb-80-E5 TaxID=2081050 RepID=UPI001C0C0ECD|nr:hypothetical protein [Polynucleobacter sp. JS-Fieb-80-E5]MBU3619641.1 hypothetical protein [Polynucleobacter sp. JS-Fieb-80-E5]